MSYATDVVAQAFMCWVPGSASIPVTDMYARRCSAQSSSKPSLLLVAYSLLLSHTLTVIRFSHSKGHRREAAMSIAHI